MARFLLSILAIVGVAALDVAFIPAVVIVLAGLWAFAAFERHDLILD